MNATWSLILSLLLPFLQSLLGGLTPAIKDEMIGLLQGLYLKALATPSAWDDFAVGIILDILSIPRPTGGAS